VKTIAEFLFTLGSDPDTKDKYRKSLYDLHKKFMRRLKKIGKDVEILTDEDGNEIYDDNEGGNGDGVDDVTLNNIDESIQFLEAETNEDGDVDMLDDEPAKEEESVDKAKKESKKKKKKKRKSMDQESRPEPEITPITNDTVVNEKRKKKKKKSDSGEADVDEEVVITLTEQQDAKKKDRKSKKKLKEQKEEKASADSEKKEKKGTRRVSFGAKNRAKSHKASMKALRTTEPPSTKETVPEKGILRKIPRHGKNTSSVLSKKQRKKATSYF
jgi:hypothetical protein